jgi:hypothetical protein
MDRKGWRGSSAERVINGLLSFSSPVCLFVIICLSAKEKKLCKAEQPGASALGIGVNNHVFDTHAPLSVVVRRACFPVRATC